MNKRVILLISILIALSTQVSAAKEVVLSTNQSEYYFLIGQEAKLELEIDNEFKETIHGTMSYTITQNINQGGFQYSNTNTQSQSVTIEPKPSSIGISFGTSDQLLSLDVNIAFSYEDKVSELDNLLIHFVNNPDQQQNQENKKESKTRNADEQKKQEQDPFDEMQKKMDEMFNQKTPQQQDSQQKVQNNQMNQNMDSIKRQMQEELEAKQALNKAFQEELSRNPDFLQKHQELADQGFNPTQGRVDATSNNTGDFNIDYEKGEEKAELKGRMENSTLTEISSTLDQKRYLETLYQDDLYKKYDQELKNASFNPLQPEFSELENIALKQRIESLMTRCGFTSSGILVMDGSKRSSHGNAYFTGLGKNKRIVFFDNLLNSLDDEEIEAVLAHELGHFKKKHILKRMISMAFITLGGFAILGYLMQQQWFYNGLGVETSSIYMALILFTLTSAIFAFPFTPLSSLLSRKHEFEADDYASSQTNAQKLIDALVKLYKDNNSTLTPDPVFSAWYDSHPPASVRVENLKKNNSR